jgi:hypothetical protein
MKEKTMFAKKTALGIAALSFAIGLAACQKKDEAAADKGTGEKAGAQVDAATSKAADALNKAAEKAGRALQSAGEKGGEAVKKGGEKLEGSAKDAQKKE